MADRYAELPGSATTIWADTATWKATSTGATGASIPTSEDNVFIDANSVNGADAILNIADAASCLNFDCTGATNSPRLNSLAVLSIYGDFTTIAAMSWTNTTTIRLRQLSGTKTITTNGLVIGPAVQTYADGGAYSFADSFATNSTFFHTAGNILTNNNTFTCALFDESSTTTRTLTLGSSAVACTAWSYTGSGLTLATNTSTITVTGTGVFAGGSITTYNNIILTGTHTVSGTFTCATFSSTATAVATDVLTITDNITVTGEATFAGNSVVNRLLVQSATIGTAVTVAIGTRAAATTNVDFIDIVGAGGSWNLSSRSAGDCGGNTGITFPDAVAQTSSKASTWSDATMWTSRIPLPQDDVSCGHNVTIDMPRIGKNVTFTGTPTLSGSTSIDIFGSFVLPAGAASSTTGRFWFKGRGNYTITTNNVAVYRWAVQAPTGTYTLQDSITWTTGEDSDLYAGTLNTNGQALVGGFFYFYSALTKVLTLGASTVTLNGIGATTKWGQQTSGFTGLTFNANTSTIVLTNSSTSSQTFAGGGLTYNNLTIQGAGNYTTTITGNNTFSTLTIDTSVNDKTVVLTGTIQTITTFTCTTNAGKFCYINNGTLTKSGGGVVSLDNMIITGNTATPSSTWSAGDNSADGSGNSGWTFSKPAFKQTYVGLGIPIRV
jgi:hypothetical protein